MLFVAIFSILGVICLAKPQHILKKNSKCVSKQYEKMTILKKY